MALSQTAAFGDIALSIQRRLVSQLSLDESCVRIVATDNYEIESADQFFVYVRCYGPSPVTDAGKGRGYRPTKRLVRVYLYARSSKDFTGSDKLALTEATSGLFRREEQILAGLDDWFPLNEAGTTALTPEPLHPMDSSSGPPERKPENDVGLVRSSSLWQVVYAPALTVAVP